jgi:acyl carrier protein
MIERDGSMQENNLIQNRLMDVFREKLELDVPSMETDLMHTGLMDSLVFVELLFQLEQEFGVIIAMDKLELDNFRSIDSIVQFIEQTEEAV